MVRFLMRNLSVTIIKTSKTWVIKGDGGRTKHQIVVEKTSINLDDSSFFVCRKMKSALRNRGNMHVMLGR